MIYYYVNTISGIDELDAGTQNKPFKTLDYCITQIHSKNIQKLNIEYEEQVLSLLSNPIEILNEEAENERQEYLSSIISRGYTDDITIFLDKGEYQISNRKIFNGAENKNLFVIGLGKETILNIDKSMGTTSGNGTVGFNLHLYRMIITTNAVSGTNFLLASCNLHTKNILFKDIPEFTYAFWSFSNSALKNVGVLQNCVQNNNTSILRQTTAYNTENSIGNYGKFACKYACRTEEFPNKSTNKIVDNVELDENYKIIDPSVDTSKIGLYAGEYTWFEQNCLIKMDNKYYSILEEFWNTETKNFTNVGSKDFEKSFNLQNLTKELTYGEDTFIPLEKFDNFSIVFKDETIEKLNIGGYKIENKIVMTNPIDMRMVENFNSIAINGTNVKCLIKFNEEEQYYTYNFEESIFENEEIDNIATNGIDISKIKDIDFNKIKEEKDLKNVTFAFFLQQDSIVNNIIIDYLEIGEFSQKTSTETKLKVGYKKISIQPTFNANLLKINVL